MMRIVKIRSRVRVEIGLVGWIARVREKISLRMKEKGVYMWPRGFGVSYS